MNKKRRTTVRKHIRHNPNGSVSKVKRHERNLPDNRGKQRSRFIPKPPYVQDQIQSKEEEFFYPLSKIPLELTKIRDEYENLTSSNFWKIIIRTISSDFTNQNLPKDLKYTKEVLNILNDYRTSKISEEEMYKEFKSLGKKVLVMSIKKTTAYAISTNTRIPYPLIKPCSDLFIDSGVKGLEQIFQEDS